MAKAFKKFHTDKPDGELRQSQLITTFGPGAMIDLLEQAALLSGLDHWQYANPQHSVIAEPRLRDALAERFARAGRPLGYDAFRRPPTSEDDRARRDVGVTVLEFPSWFVCQSHECRALVRGRSLETKHGRYWHRCDRGTSPAPTVPIRFVMACAAGHLQEFPWLDFAHKDAAPGQCSSARLELREDATGDVSGIRVRCQCGAAASLGDAHTGPQLTCRGERPWLGADASEVCGLRARMLVRTASNSYFAQVVSALSIPEPGKELDDAVSPHLSTLSAAENLDDLKMFLRPRHIKEALAHFSPEDIFAAVTRLTRGGSERMHIRAAEFKQLTSAKLESPGDLPASDDLFFARECRPAERPPQISRLVLVPKLREVRAQVGFTRLEPASAGLDGEFDLDVQSASLSIAADWLPAIEIQGEGVLIQLNEEAVRAWEDRRQVQERAEQLRRAHAAALRNNPGAGKCHGVRYYMLHSLSHLLITAISLECGYSASAIRERIYCSASRTDPQPMAAILLSTGTSGSEGTLGGLVDQGRRIIEHLRRAFDLGRLCSNDPICASHNPEDDAVERYLEGAACHGCLFIAEPSCERYNRYLDRALVVPCLDHQEIAFFRERP